MLPKTEVEIEKLLTWAYRDELSKRQTSAAEGIWDRIEDNGQRGGIDPGHGAAQRYAHFGLPDPDAEAIERAVGQLEDVVIDWEQSLETIAGELSGLVSINDFSRRPAADPGKATTAGWTDARTGQWRQAENRPRDMLMLGTMRPKALVTMHAIQGTRPDWRDDPPLPYAIQADKGPNAKIIGECKGKNLYTAGSYCPLQWDPSPVSIIMARAEYAVWWEALQTLSETLVLANHIALPPRAAPRPWAEQNERDDVRIVPVVPTSTNRASLWGTLPLKPARGKMLGPLRHPLAGPVRYPLEDVG